MSERFTITVSDETDEWVAEAVESGEYGSKSEVAQEGLALLRRVEEEGVDVETLLEARDRVDELEDELQHAEAERDDLQRQLAAANQRIDATNEIVRYVEDERTAEQRRREASAVTRAKWWLLGEPTDGEGDE